MDDESAKRFEAFANAQAAEIEATRTILESLIVQMFGTFQHGDLMMAQLREISLQPLRDTASLAKTPDEKRKAELVLQQASGILDYLSGRVAEARAPEPRKN